MNALYLLTAADYALEAVDKVWIGTDALGKVLLYFVAGTTFLSIEIILLALLYYRHELHQHGVDSQFY